MTTLVKHCIEAGEGRRNAATNGDYRRTLEAVVQESPLGQQPAKQDSNGAAVFTTQGVPGAYTLEVVNLVRRSAGR